MARLPRPSIPLSVRLDVALRQLGYTDKERQAFIGVGKEARCMGKMLESYLVELANRMGCPRDQLRLDHDPALENRTQIKGYNDQIVRYYPNANDPEHLQYRPHAAEYAGSHHIKTNVRGDNGQFSDNMLAKRKRKIAKKQERRRAGKVKKIASRKTAWPPRGSRKLRSRTRFTGG